MSASERGSIAELPHHHVVITVILNLRLERPLEVARRWERQASANPRVDFRAQKEPPRVAFFSASVATAAYPQKQKEEGRDGVHHDKDQRCSGKCALHDLINAQRFGRQIELPHRSVVPERLRCLQRLTRCVEDDATAIHLPIEVERSHRHGYVLVADTEETVDIDDGGHHPLVRVE
jgi:hypothetical protein